MDALCRATAGAPRGGRRLVLSGLRRAWLRVDDPNIRIEIDGSSLLLPFSHELPVYRSLFPEYSANLGRIARVVQEHHPGTIVDIGANVGDSVAIIRWHSDAPILCVEGDSVYLPYLATNTARFADVEIEPSYVATTSDARSYTVERFGGTARIVPLADLVVDGSDTGGSTHKRLTVEASPLEEVLSRHPNLPQPSLLKIDTDGNDPGIIQSAAPLIARTHPTIFFEFDPRLVEEITGNDGTEVFSLLDELGYRDLLLFANTGPLLCRVHSRERSLLGDLAAFVGASQPIEYFDICAIHLDNAAMVPEILASENAARQMVQGLGPREN